MVSFTLKDILLPKKLFFVMMTEQIIAVQHEQYNDKSRSDNTDSDKDLSYTFIFIIIDIL